MSKTLYFARKCEDDHPWLFVILRETKTEHGLTICSEWIPLYKKWAYLEGGFHCPPNKILLTSESLEEVIDFIISFPKNETHQRRIEQYVSPLI